MTLSYKFVEVDTPKGRLLRPYMPVTLRFEGYEPLDTVMMIDSGADFSMIEGALAEELRIPVNALPISRISGQRHCKSCRD